MNTTVTAPATLVDVEVTEVPNDGCSVYPMWQVGGERIEGSGYRVKNRQMADRLKSAMLAGAVYYAVEVLTDVNGRPFVSASAHVLARTMNADLRRLGF